RKMRIGVLQFLKNENARFGEIKAAEQMGGIDWISTGDGWTWTSHDMDETEARARHVVRTILFVMGFPPYDR
ncbi:MAG: hypothetical protein HGA94_04730, partial [Candidatus Aminicenantes bacterium]|nr:hypothetical protein [Candidatus Aminicenantes bacterium]